MALLCSRATQFSLKSMQSPPLYMRFKTLRPTQGSLLIILSASKKVRWGTLVCEPASCFITGWEWAGWINVSSMLIKETFVFPWTAPAVPFSPLILFSWINLDCWLSCITKTVLLFLFWVLSTVGMLYYCILIWIKSNTKELVSPAFVTSYCLSESRSLFTVISNLPQEIILFFSSEMHSV